MIIITQYNDILDKTMGYVSSRLDKHNINLTGYKTQGESILKDIDALYSIISSDKMNEILNKLEKEKFKI